MNTKYKSSFFVTYSQYIITPIVFFMFFFEVFFMNSGGINALFHMESTPIFLWIVFALVMNLVKLRYVNINEENILVNFFGIKKVLNYKDIEWINQSKLGSNWNIITIKYKDENTGLSKSFFFFPEILNDPTSKNLSMFNPFRELGVTKFIREKIIEVNKEYSKEMEPSAWYFPRKVFLSLVPFLIIYFLIK